MYLTYILLHFVFQFLYLHTWPQLEYCCRYRCKTFLVKTANACIFSIVNRKKSVLSAAGCSPRFGLSRKLQTVFMVLHIRWAFNWWVLELWRIKESRKHFRSKRCFICIKNLLHGYVWNFRSFQNWQHIYNCLDKQTNCPQQENFELVDKFWEFCR